MEVSGVLFVVEKDDNGQYEMFVLNRLSLKNLSIPLDAIKATYQLKSFIILILSEGLSFLILERYELLKRTIGTTNF